MRELKTYTSVERFGNNILYVGYDEQGKRHRQRIYFKPKFYVPNSGGECQSLFGDNLSVIEHESMRDAADFVKRYEHVDNFKIFGTTDYVAQFISEQFPNGCTYNADLVNIAFIDIEVKSDEGFPLPGLARHPVTAITVQMTNDPAYYTYACGDYIPQDEQEVYMKCADEHELLLQFLAHWANNTPDVVTGWNVKFFDIPYLVNRIEKILGEDHLKKLSIHKMKPHARDDKYEGQHYVIPGLSTLDYLHLFKKFGYSYGSQDSYKLDSIANVVLGEAKIDYSEYASLNELYLKDHQKFIEYNIHDVRLVRRIEDATGLLSLAITLSYMANCNFEMAFGSVRIWETFIYNVMKRRDIFPPIRKQSSSTRSIEGAYVKPPQIGMHKWVCSFDLNSLYPHLIMGYNMSTETIGPMLGGHNVEDLLKETPVDVPDGYCITPGGQTFKTNKRGIFPSIVDELYDTRSRVKKQMLGVQQTIEEKGKSPELEAERVRMNNEQMAVKILMNSLYGAMSNQWFLYYEPNMAEAITLSGQLTVRWAEKAVNEYLRKVLGGDTSKDYILAMDTDSIYVCLDDLVQKVGLTDEDEICKFLDKAATAKLEPVLEKAFDRLKDYLKAYEQRMVMQREVIGSNILFTGKKRYIVRALNNEGVQYTEPKIKITGIESVRSSTPMLCRKWIEQAMKIIMDNDQRALQKFIADCADEFKTLPAEEIAFPRGIKDVAKYMENGKYRKGTPIQVRAAILYNNMLKAKNLENKYESIHNGDKIRFMYLTMPNPTNENVIAFSTIYPKELELEDYIDYDTQFDKTFREPIKHILDAIGWTLDEIGTLEDFFT